MFYDHAILDHIVQKAVQVCTFARHAVQQILGSEQQNRQAVLNRLHGGCSQINVLMHVYRIKKTTRAQYLRNFSRSTDVCEVCGNASLEPFVPSLSAVKARKSFACEVGSDLEVHGMRESCQLGALQLVPAAASH
jgi:hypothetical protein